MLTVALTVLVGLVAISVAANLAARAARYRYHRRMYPHAPRGRVWKHVR